MEKTATLNLRVNPEVKERAEKVLAQLGVPMSTRWCERSAVYCKVTNHQFTCMASLF